MKVLGWELTIRKAKKMKVSGWELSIGTYQGICFGIRSYPEKTKTDHVLYIPFLDLCLTVYYEPDEE